MSRVLLVEDEMHLADGLRFNLEAEGHSVDIVGDGEAAIRRLARDCELFDAVVLDVMLPFRDGFEVVAAMRAAKNYAPVLMLTARSRPEDVLRGFAAGADDYLPKPFELPIFLARLQGLLRRSAWLRDSGAPPAQENGTVAANSDVYTFDGKKIDFSALELQSGDTTIQLTLMEAKLLRHLIENKGKVVTRKSILEDVWGLHEDTDTRAIDNFVVRLRRYIEDDPTNPQRLLTVRGVGYRFVEPEKAKRKR
ncbi:MAG TPA: response regulator transcription factor [Candidatus Acidoferrales bacterium]|jgi:DNA-binding response OmpR family regulator|nr:response regulator transcription factor [Candidatus Acidoferrales bacterium]